MKDVQPMYHPRCFSPFYIVRPFLQIQKFDLQHYCQVSYTPWVEDPSNQDTSKWLEQDSNQKDGGGEQHWVHNFEAASQKSAQVCGASTVYYPAEILIGAGVFTVVGVAFTTDSLVTVDVVDAVAVARAVIAVVVVVVVVMVVPALDLALALALAVVGSSSSSLLLRGQAGGIVDSYQVGLDVMDAFVLHERRSKTLL
eukprot:gene3964-6422_t